MECKTGSDSGFMSNARLWY